MSAGWIMEGVNILVTIVMVIINATVMVAILLIVTTTAVLVGIHVFYYLLIIFLTLDVNECELNAHLCQHDCYNTNGSYTCDCRSGYLLDGNGLHCNGTMAINL